jgi:hypothetical protein
MHFAARVRTCSVARLYSVLYSEIVLSRKQFEIGHMCIYIFFFFLLRIADTMTSQNTDISFWDTLYNKQKLPVEVKEKCEFYLRE